MVVVNFHYIKQVFPRELRVFRVFESRLIAAFRRKSSVEFLHNCLREKVVPKCLFVSHFVNWNNDPFPSIYSTLLHNRIYTIKRELSYIFTCVSSMRRFLVASLPPLVSRFLFFIAYRRANVILSGSRRHLSEKLSYLCTRSCWASFDDPKKVVNLSSRQLSPVESQALSLGPKFSLGHTPSSILTSLSSFRNHKLVLPLATRCLKRCRPFLPARYLAALRCIQRDRSIIVRRADKGGALVIMDRADYVSKMVSILDDAETYRPIPSDPLQSQVYSFKRLVRPLLPPDVYKKVSVSSPSLPYIFGAPKVHKEGVPLRPVIASCNSVFSSLERWLADFLSPLLGTVSRSHLRNSADFIDRVGHFNVSGRLMMSYDVISLFSRVPIPKVLDYIRELDPSHLFPISTSNFVSLLGICMQQNLFSFNGGFYAQIFGASMGGSLSPVLACLFMEFFEDRLLPNVPSFPSIVCWLRYVDDVYVLANADLDVPTFLSDINSLEDSIKFTVEGESDGSIPFLDVRVHRSYPLTFSVYRKPSFSGNLMNAYSYHSSSVKRGSIVGAFLRAYRLSSPQFLDAEFAFLFNLFDGLGFPSHFVFKCRSIASSIHHSAAENLLRPPSDDSLPRVFVPYCSLLDQLSWTLRSVSGVRLVFTYPYTISSLLVRTSPKNTVLCGVYRVPCSVCNLQYWGETSKPLTVRVGQHKYAVRTGLSSSAIFQHISSEGHMIDFDSSELVYRSMDRSVRHFVESVYIASGDSMNLSEGFFVLDRVTLDFANSLIAKR